MSMAVLSAASQSLVVGSRDSSVQLWDTANGKLKKKLNGLPHGAGSVAMLGDQRAQAA